MEQDGAEFRKEAIEIQRIKEDAEYEGARVRLTATVSKASLVVQVDIGFGDSIVPRPTEIEYPVLLEFPVPQLLAYARQSCFFPASYFPDRLKKFPNSRFLFVYSGHGFFEGTSSYVLTSAAQSFDDREHSINLANLKVLVDDIGPDAFQVLVLLNSYSPVLLLF